MTIGRALRKMFAKCPGLSGFFSGKKPAPGKENVAPKDVAAGPVDVAAVLKARAAAKKKGSKPVSAAAQAALANAKARPAQKKKAPKGRQVADPGCNGY